MIAAVIILLVGVTVAAHEAGHAVAAQAFGLPWRPTLSWRGPGMVVGSDDITLTRWQQAATCAAGPLANFLLAAAAVAAHMPLLALLNIEFALVNLLPLPHSDGRRIYWAIRLPR